MSLKILNNRDKKTCESLGISEEVAGIIENCDCGIINRARLENLNNLRRWEIMEVIGNYLDPMSKTVPNWSDFKRLATFCRAFGIEESEVTGLYAEAISNEGAKIGYEVADNLILILWEDEAETERAEAVERVLTEGDNNPLVTALEVSQSRKTSKYNPTKTDLKEGFYFEYYGLKVPFSAIFDENNKTKGIVGVAFGSAKDCPSRSLGLCQLPTDALCYAVTGERRATKKENETGIKGMDSYFKGCLCSVFWDLYESEEAIRVKFHDYLDFYGIQTIRFNLKSDFRHSLDCVAIFHLAEYGYNLVGYTARDDLKDCEALGNHPNIILNGSNRKYTNRFKATDNIAEYLGAKYSCLGSCANCRKCYTLRGVEITVLVHGKGSESQLNNPENRKWLVENVLNGAGASFFEVKDFERGKELVTCINKTFKAIFGEGLPEFCTTKEFLEFIGGK